MQGKIALVTGAGSERGIGKSTAYELAKRGATVIAADINIDGAKKVAKELDEKGYRAVGKRVDVTSRESVNNLIQCTINEFGRIDILVNNAGITKSTNILDITDEEWDLIFSINMKGIFYSTQAVLPSMLKHKYGRIVNLSSIAGKQGGGVFGTSHYAASKAGVLGFSKSVAREVSEHGITVNCVTPGLIDTDITADMSSTVRAERHNQIVMKRPGTTKEVAATIAFLASTDASYITGEEIDVNGGLLMD